MKKKMGRPKLPKNKARSILLTTRVNADEEQVIHSAIKASGLGKTAWLRSALLKAA
jgi:hypothetical protein